MRILYCRKMAFVIFLLANVIFLHVSFERVFVWLFLMCMYHENSYLCVLWCRGVKVLNSAKTGHLGPFSEAEFRLHGQNKFVNLQNKNLKQITSPMQQKVNTTPSSKPMFFGVHKNAEKYGLSFSGFFCKKNSDFIIMTLHLAFL